MRGGRVPTHVHEEEHHLGLGEPSADALAGAEAEGQRPEAGVVFAEPTGRVVALGVGEDVRAAAHGVQGHLAQRLRAGGGVSAGTPPLGTPGTPPVLTPAGTR